MAGQLFDVGNGDKVRRGSDRRAETADTASPADGKQDRERHAAFRHVILADRAQHGDGNRTEDSGHDDVWKENGKDGRCEEPDENLVFHRSPDEAERFDRHALVEARRRPCQTDEIGSQEQDGDFRKVLADDVGIRDQVEEGIDDNRHEGCDVNRYRPDDPPERHPDGRCDGERGRGRERAPKKKSRQEE